MHEKKQPPLWRRTLWMLCAGLCGLAVLAAAGCKKKDPFDFTAIAGIYAVRVTQTTYGLTTVDDVYRATISDTGQLRLEVAYRFSEDYQLESSSGDLAATAQDAVDTGTTGPGGEPLQAAVTDEVEVLLDADGQPEEIVWQRSVEDARYGDLGGQVRYEVQMTADTATRSRLSWTAQLESAAPADFIPAAAAFGIDHHQLLSITHGDTTERSYQLWRESAYRYTGQVTTTQGFLCSSMQLPEGYSLRTISVQLADEIVNGLTTAFDTAEETFFSGTDDPIELYYPPASP